MHDYWTSLGYKVREWHDGNREDKYFYCYRSRFISKYVEANDAFEYIVIPGFKNPRWIILNKKNILDQPGLIIKPTSFMSKLVWTGAKIFNKFNLFTAVFPDRLIVKGSKMGATVFDGNGYDPNILYTGAPGRYQKFTIQYVNEHNEPSGYFKSANSKGGIARIVNEFKGLEKLSKHDLKYMEIPQLLEQFENRRFVGFLQGNIIKKESITVSLTENDILALSELHNQLGFQAVNLSEYLKEINLHQYKEDLSFVIDYFNSKTEKTIFLASSHGDYTPWNRFVSGNKVKVIDWETFGHRPLFYDLCYFMMHKAILIKKVSVASAVNESLAYLNKLLSYLDKSRIDHQFINVEFYLLLNLIELYLHYKKNNHKTDRFFLKQIKDSLIVTQKKLM